MADVFDVLHEDHDEVRRILTELGRHDADDPEFERLLDWFVHDGRAHIAYEETEVWPALRARLTAGEAAELADRVIRAKERATPHPEPPPKPGGPIAAATDKIRDVLGGLGSRA